MATGTDAIMAERRAGGYPLSVVGERDALQVDKGTTAAYDTTAAVNEGGAVQVYISVTSFASALLVPAYSVVQCHSLSSCPSSAYL